MVAAHRHHLSKAFSKIGLIPDSGTYFYPDWSAGRASALDDARRKVSSAEAERSGYGFKVFADESFVDESYKIANTLAQMPTKGPIYQACSELFFPQFFWSTTVKEDELQQKASRTYDYNEGVCISWKKIPVFKGE